MKGQVLGTEVPKPVRLTRMNCSESIGDTIERQGEAVGGTLTMMNENSLIQTMEDHCIASWGMSLMRRGDNGYRTQLEVQIGLEP